MRKIYPTLILVFLLLADTVHGQGIGLNLKEQPGGLIVGSDRPDVLTSNLIRNVITLFFTVGAIGFTIMVIWGAVSWILSGGDKEKIAGARRRITTAIIGIILLSLSFVIMVVIGQITGIESLYSGVFEIPGLLD